MENKVTLKCKLNLIGVIQTIILYEKPSVIVHVNFDMLNQEYSRYCQCSSFSSAKSAPPKAHMTLHKIKLTESISNSLLYLQPLVRDPGDCSRKLLLSSLIAADHANLTKWSMRIWKLFPFSILVHCRSKTFVFV